MSDSHLLGVPVDNDSYDYAGQVRWNRDAGRLWDRTRTRLARALPDLDYCVVREWQARGVVHMHAMIRVPVGVTVSPGVVARIARESSTTVADPEFPDDVKKRHAIGWGRKVDCQSVGLDAREAKRVTGYMAKVISYSNKSITDEFHSASRKHGAWLDQAARSMWCDRCPRGRIFSGPRHCKSATHNRYGARSSIVSASRLTFTGETGEVKKTGWSMVGLNRSSQRAARLAWAAANKAATDNTAMSTAMALSIASRRFLEGPHVPPHMGAPEPPAPMPSEG